MKKIFLSTIALAFLFSCEQAAIMPEPDNSNKELYASIEEFNITKTSMDANRNVVWSEGDQLVAFMGSTLKSKYQIKQDYVGCASGSFTNVTESIEGNTTEGIQELNHNVIYYPYSSEVTCLMNNTGDSDKSYTLNINIPESQAYSSESFANGAFPMVAVSTSNRLTFKNVCGGLKLQFKGSDKIKSIKLEGLSDEKLAGSATLTAYANGSKPEINMNDNAAAYVLLDCGEGVQLDENTPTTFIIAVPPVTFTSGMKITITDTDGYSRVLANSSENTILRSSLLTFPALTYTQVGVFELPEGAMESYEVEADGGNIEVSIKTNQNFEVVIPADAQEWINIVESKAVREETILFSIAENTSIDERSAEILFTANDGTVLQSINILQKAIPLPVVDIEYIENGVNYGPGILIDDMIWAPVNVGAETQSEYGDYYNWIEAHRVCPEGWRVPTSKEYSSLRANSEWGELDGVAGRYFYGGKKYRTSIFLPAAGSDDQRVQPGYAGYYVTSTNTWRPTYGYASTFTSQSVGSSEINVNSTQKYSVRCVASNEDKPTEKTINGLTWKTMNVGAQEINEDGNCYYCEIAPLACPDGWRVPTMDEFNSLKQNSQFTNIDGVNGYWMSGTNIHPGENTGIFIPIAKWYYDTREDGIIEGSKDESIYMTSTKSTYMNGTQGFTFGSNYDFSATQMGLTGDYVPLRCVKGTIENPYIRTSSISTLPYEGGTATIDITSNVEGFSVEISEEAASWITAEINGNRITINVAENLAYYRYGTIRIVADNHLNTYKDVTIYQNGWVTNFNSSYYIGYKANATREYTGRDDQNVYDYKSVIRSTDATGVKVEMKFQLTGSGAYYYLASSGNQWDDDGDYSSFEIPSNGLDLDGTVYTWSQMGVSNTSLITLVFDGAKGTITINNKKTLTTSMESMSWDYLFSAYGRYREDGETSYEEFGVPEGSKLYYVKMYDSNGKETYVGHAAKAKNPATGKEEYCWYSNNNGKMECQFANDSANQGGYTGNF